MEVTPYTALIIDEPPCFLSLQLFCKLLEGRNDVLPTMISQCLANCLSVGTKNILLNI